MAQLKVQSFVHDDAVGKIRRLSVVLDTSVKEMEKDFENSVGVEISIKASVLWFTRKPFHPNHTQGRFLTLSLRHTLLLSADYHEALELSLPPQTGPEFKCRTR